MFASSSGQRPNSKPASFGPFPGSHPAGSLRSTGWSGIIPLGSSHGSGLRIFPARTRSWTLWWWVATWITWRLEVKTDDERRPWKKLDWITWSFDYMVYVYTIVCDGCEISWVCLLRLFICAFLVVWFSRVFLTYLFQHGLSFESGHAPTQCSKRAEDITYLRSLWA